MERNTDKITIHPASTERWPDLERLFGPRGACGGCWCMFWRLSRAQFEAEKGEGNRSALRALVEAGDEPGLIAYVDGTPAGWCCLALRAEFPRLARSRTLSPVDELPVWSIVCFYIDKAFRRQGLSLALLRSAVAYAQAHGAQIVEGYPHDYDSEESQPAPFVYTGLASAFRQAGFIEVARRSSRRPIMRWMAPIETLNPAHLDAPSNADTISSGETFASYTRSEE